MAEEEYTMADVVMEDEHVSIAGMPSVALSIKNPFMPSLDDVRLEMPLEATMLDVKLHLQREYVGNPEPALQNLIVGGHTLKDSTPLCEICKQEDLSEPFIMHLLVSTYAKDGSCSSPGTPNPLQVPPLVQPILFTSSPGNSSVFPKKPVRKRGQASSSSTTRRSSPKPSTAELNGPQEIPSAATSSSRAGEGAPAFEFGRTGPHSFQTPSIASSVNGGGGSGPGSAAAETSPGLPNLANWSPRFPSAAGFPEPGPSSLLGSLSPYRPLPQPIGDDLQPGGPFAQARNSMRASAYGLLPDILPPDFPLLRNYATNNPNNVPNDRNPPSPGLPEEDADFFDFLVARFRERQRPEEEEAGQRRDEESRFQVHGRGLGAEATFVGRIGGHGQPPMGRRVQIHIRIDLVLMIAVVFAFGFLTARLCGESVLPKVLVSAAIALMVSYQSGALALVRTFIRLAMRGFSSGRPHPPGNNESDNREVREGGNRAGQGGQEATDTGAEHPPPPFRQPRFRSPPDWLMGEAFRTGEIPQREAGRQHQD